MARVTTLPAGRGATPAPGRLGGETLAPGNVGSAPLGDPLPDPVDDGDRDRQGGWAPSTVADGSRVRRGRLRDLGRGNDRGCDHLGHCRPSRALNPPLRRSSPRRDSVGKGPSVGWCVASRSTNHARRTSASPGHQQSGNACCRSRDAIGRQDARTRWGYSPLQSSACPQRTAEDHDECDGPDDDSTESRHCADKPGRPPSQAVPIAANPIAAHRTVSRLTGGSNWREPEARSHTRIAPDKANISRAALAADQPCPANHCSAISHPCVPAPRRSTQKVGRTGQLGCQRPSDCTRLGRIVAWVVGHEVTGLGWARQFPDLKGMPFRTQ